MAIDILIPLGTGSLHRNLELRCCVASIRRHVVGYRRIVVVGAPIGFELPGVDYVPFRQPRWNKEAAIASVIQHACWRADLSPEFAMFNDDYVVTKRLELETYPNYFNGSLLERAAVNSSTYRFSLRSTAFELKAVGKGQLNFDVHMPMRMRTDMFLALGPWWARSASTTHGLVVKSLYGNLYEIEGTYHADAKLSRQTTEQIREIASQRDVISYSDAAVKRVCSLFPPEETECQATA